MTSSDHAALYEKPRLGGARRTLGVAEQFVRDGACRSHDIGDRGVGASQLDFAADSRAGQLGEVDGQHVHPHAADERRPLLVDHHRCAVAGRARSRPPHTLMRPARVAWRDRPRNAPAADRFAGSHVEHLDDLASCLRSQFAPTYSQGNSRPLSWRGAAAAADAPPGDSARCRTRPDRCPACGR